MKYLNYTVVNGVVTAGSQTTIDGHCKFYVSGNIWSLDGPTLGFLCSIAVVWVNQAAGRVSIDPRPIGNIITVNFTTWGTAVQQSDGSYVISIA